MAIRNFEACNNKNNNKKRENFYKKKKNPNIDSLVWREMNRVNTNTHTHTQFQLSYVSI